MKLRISVLIAGLMLAIFSISQWERLDSLVKDFMPVRYVRVEGSFQYLNKQEIKQVLMPLVTTDLISADIKAMQTAAETLPWVFQADIKRVWPDAIDVKVYEQKPIARWGETGLLNARGEVFIPGSLDEFKGLPLIAGPQGQERRLLEIMKGLQTALADLSLELKVFRVSERLSWKLELANGMQLQLGRREPLNNLQRFLKTLPLLGAEKIDAMMAVDMRYPNGFAVTWKPGRVIEWRAADETETRI